MVHLERFMIFFLYSYSTSLEFESVRDIHQINLER